MPIVFLDVGQRILDIAAVAAMLRDPGLMPGDLQRLPEAIKMVPAQGELIRNNILVVH